LFKAILLAASITLASFGTYAEETAPAFEYKLISYSDTTGSGVKLTKEDFPNGVFVTSVGGWSTTYQKTADMLKANLREKGVKVVEAPDVADIGIQIYGTAFNLEEVETGLDAGFDKANAAVFVAGIFLTGGINVVGELARPDSDPNTVKCTITARIFKKPTLNSRGKMDGAEELESVTTDLLYKSNEPGYKGATAAYMSFIQKLVENHFVVDLNKTETVPASSSNNS